ncbi:hypothetical protein Mgra_00003295 [Meloidogyne graminicola]|uniref:Uncharacterized protein n=1 Tax=Meloidogyne graminicola TaxID=189291 RepID=A0A8S9ZVN0_9BILA|nr:hypothetical protein Mgra_00003295 [Meloidogyne graminicola]
MYKNKIFWLFVVILLLGNLFVVSAKPRKPMTKSPPTEDPDNGVDDKKKKGKEEDCPLGNTTIILLVLLGVAALLMLIVAVVFIILFFNLKSKLEKMEVDYKGYMKWAEMDKDYSKLDLGSAYQTNKKKGGVKKK